MMYLVIIGFLAFYETIKIDEFVKNHSPVSVIVREPGNPGKSSHRTGDL